MLRGKPSCPSFLPRWCSGESQSSRRLRRSSITFCLAERQRGTETVFVLNRARLSDAKEILLYDPGLTVTKLEVVNDNQVKATLRSAADCRLGEYALRLRTAGGLTELRTLYIGALPVIEEKEPNSEFTSPQKIPLNVTVHGTVDNEDVDYFQVECKKGQRLECRDRRHAAGRDDVRSLCRHSRHETLRIGRLRR